MNDYDIIIQGGGLTGLALSAALADSNVKAICVEQRPIEATTDPTFDGRVTALAYASRRLFETCGVWPIMADQAEPILHIEVAEAGGIGAVHYDYRDVGDEPMGHIVENRVIRNALIKRIESAPNIELAAPFKANSVTRQRHCLTIESDAGRTIEAPLLALCEGRLSQTRDRLGFKSKRSDYHQNGIVCTLAHELPHEGWAIERFFPDGPFAVLPLPGNRSSIVWALDEERAKAVTALSDAEFACEVAERFGDKLGHVELEGPRWHYPLTLVTCEKLAHDRVALVGDTARGIHPIAGQGWNLALRDVAALAELVAEAVHLGLDCGGDQTLQRYVQWRSFDSQTLVTVTDGINHLFSNDIAPLHMMRDAGLALVDHLPPAKRLFMNHAMGTLGDMPKLMRGQPLT